MANLNFSNTAVAFKHLNNQQLAKAYWMFKLMNNPTLVNWSTGISKWAIQKKLPIKAIIKATVFSQFCGGETIEECLPTIEKMGKYKVGSILDYSVEGKSTEEEFEEGVAETIKTIEMAAKNPNIPFAVFKITGVASFGLLVKVNDKKSLSNAENEAWEKVKNRVYRICEKAHQLNQPIFIDAEESWIQQSIDDLATNMMQAFNQKQPIVYNTIQLYRHDRLAFLQSCFEKAKNENYFLAVKLVRGAYMEKERARAKKLNYIDPIQPNKKASDNDYDAALQFCLNNIEHISICAGTHNEQSNLLLASLMEKKQLPKNHPHVWFSQLFGMSDNLSYNLASEGFNVCKYLPYGPVESVLPYLIRRAEENTAMAGQMSRELNLLSKERNRRKNTN